MYVGVAGCDDNGEGEVGVFFDSGVIVNTPMHTHTHFKRPKVSYGSFAYYI